MTDVQGRHWRPPAAPTPRRTGPSWAPPDPAHRQDPPSSGLDRRALTRVGLLVAVILLAARLWGWWAIIAIAGFVMLLFVHELGHFLAARRAGMKVTEFFLGFGPKIWSARRGEVEYGLKAVPAGAYVRIIGMNNLDEVDPADEARTYRSKGFRSRFTVAVAGVAMNFALALVLLFVAVVGFGIPKASTWYVNTLSVDSPATLAGLQRHDQIVAVDNQPISSFDDLTTVVRARPGQSVTLTVRRGNQQLQLPVTLASRNPQSGEAVGFLGIGAAYGSERVGPLEGVKQSFVEFGRISYDSVTGLGKIFSPGGLRNYAELVSGDKSANPNERLLSPVGAVKVSTEAAETGIGLFLLLFASINIFVGLINLIPLLPFDGGHVAIACYEAIRSRRGRPYRADVRKLLPFTYAVLAVFLVLFVGNLYLDLKM